jgi:predicted phosphodiesterase
LHSHAQKIVAGPWLVKPGETGMIIRWEFDREQFDYVLEFGRDTLRSKRAALLPRDNKQGAYLYEAELSGLKPGKTYFYHLVKPFIGKWHSFRTYKEKQNKFSFVAMGDSRSNPDIFSKIMKGTENVHPDLIISMGDLVEQGSNYEQWHRFYFGVIGDFVASIPLVSTLGDHETEGDNGELFRYFLREKEPVEKQWFSFDFGNAHFISLDFRHPDDPEMIQWFKKDIQAAHKKWNFVYMHRPAYNLGGHRSEWGRDIWPDMFREYSVDIVFAGHSHIYERFYPVRPASEPDGTAVTYITTGGAGAELYESVNNGSVEAFSRSVNHYIDVKIDKDTLKMNTIDMNGNILDHFRITKKNGEKKFQEKIISQELLNTVTGFNTAVSQGIPYIPLRSHPVKYELELRSCSKKDIPFFVRMSESSEACYSMDPYSDTLRSGTEKNVFLNIFRKKTVTVSPWGEIEPELRLIMIYEYRGKKDTIMGGAVHYWPPWE